MDCQRQAEPEHAAKRTNQATLQRTQQVQWCDSRAAQTARRSDNLVACTEGEGLIELSADGTRVGGVWVGKHMPSTATSMPITIAAQGLHEPHHVSASSASSASSA